MPLIIPLMAVCFIIDFAVQSLFCFKAKRFAVKLIPVYVSAVLALLLALMFFGAFGTWSVDILGDGQELVAGFFLIILGCGFIGDIVAWALWLACVKTKK